MERSFEILQEAFLITYAYLLAPILTKLGKTDDPILVPRVYDQYGLQASGTLYQDRKKFYKQWAETLSCRKGYDQPTAKEMLLFLSVFGDPLEIPDHDEDNKIHMALNDLLKANFAEMRMKCKAAGGPPSMIIEMLTRLI